ncbi:TPA: hypothetical protein ACH3X2_006261 [Trebouxia sp. C0005]
MIAIQVYRADKPHAAARRGRSLSGDLTGDNPKEARVGARQQGDFPAQNRFSGIRQTSRSAPRGAPHSHHWIALAADREPQMPPQALGLSLCPS